MKNKNIKIIERNEKRSRYNYFFLTLAILIFIACYQLIKPYLNPIILAAILAIVFEPIHRRIELKINNHKNLTAFISTLLIVLLVIIPLVLILLAFIQQGIVYSGLIKNFIEEKGYLQLMEYSIVHKTVDFVVSYSLKLESKFPSFSFSSIKLEKTVLDLTTLIGDKLVSNGTTIASNILVLGANFFLMLFTFFFFIRDGKKIENMLYEAIPLKLVYKKDISRKVKAVSKSVLLGTLVTAIAQGVAMGIAFFIVGLPPFFWAIVTMIVSFIPLVGPALIWIPALIYLLIVGKIVSAIFILLWSILVVGMLDNIIRPLFMKGSANMSTLIVFFAILGGVNCFGMIGILYGPLIFGIASVVFYIYATEYVKEKKNDKTL